MEPNQQKSAAELLKESLAETPPSSPPPPPQTQKPIQSETRNKYIWLIGAGIIILVLGGVYRMFFLAKEDVPVETGAVKEFTIIAKKDTWSFIPEDIEVTRGDRVILNVVNEDDYDHGIGIDAFGISQRMPANETIRIEFVATQLGDFNYYCSVPCGEGEVNGEKRTHFDMIGKIKVRESGQVQ